MRRKDVNLFLIPRNRVKRDTGQVVEVYPEEVSVKADKFKSLGEIF